MSLRELLLAQPRALHLEPRGLARDAGTVPRAAPPCLLVEPRREGARAGEHGERRAHRGAKLEQLRPGWGARRRWLGGEEEVVGG